jgi:hypothetical protein
MNAAGEGIFEKDIVRRKREVEVSTKKLPTLSAKLVPQDGGGISTRNLARMIRFAEVLFFLRLRGRLYGGGNCLVYFTFSDHASVNYC